ncbi:MAG: carbohydrate binding domain-containing protein, partial [Muribaculaceae bacterium]|nr:carbohydrate binding domain-containing protein [Muribaculaceae bacterium]
KAVVLVNPSDGSDYYVAQMAYDLDAPMVENQTYKIKFDARSSSAAGSLQIAYQNSSSYAGGLYKSVDVGTDWVTVEVEFTVPEDGKEYNRMLINFGKVAATYYIDNVKFGEYSEPVAADPMENILVGDNSDFEGGTSGGWSSWGNSSTKSVEDGVGVDGSKAVVLVNPSDGSDYYVAQMAYDLDMPLAENETYIIQFQAKSDTAAGSLQIAYQNSSSYAGGLYKGVDVGTDWVTIEVEFTMPEDGKEYNRLLINFGKIAGTYYIDNIKFGKKIEASAARVRSRAASYHYELKSAQEKREILLAYMEAWIKEAMEHCGPYCSSWDVINEPVDDSGRWRGFDGAFMSNEDADPDREPVETEQDGLTLNWANSAGNSHWYWGYFIGKDYAAKAFEYA